jgi:hypothetical protein
LGLIYVLMCGCARDAYIVPRNSYVVPSSRQWVLVWIPTSVDEDGKMVEGVERWVEIDDQWRLIRE